MPRHGIATRGRGARPRALAVALPEGAVQLGGAEDESVGGRGTRALSADYLTWTIADWQRFVRTDVRTVAGLAKEPPAVGRAFVRRVFRSPTLQALCHGSRAERLQALIVVAALLDVEFQPFTRAVDRAALAAGAVATGDRKTRTKRARLLARAAALVTQAGISPRSRLVRELERSAEAVREARRARPPGPRRRPQDTALIYSALLR